MPTGANEKKKSLLLFITPLMCPISLGIILDYT